VREGVAVWPTRSERIVGRLSLIRQHRVLFLSWLPYAPGALAPDGVFTPVPADAAPASPARGQGPDPVSPCAAAPWLMRCLAGCLCPSAATLCCGPEPHTVVFKSGDMERGVC